MTADHLTTEPRTEAGQIIGCNHIAWGSVAECPYCGIVNDMVPKAVHREEVAEALATNRAGAAQGATPRAEVVLAHCPHCNGDGCDVCYGTGQTEVAAPRAEGLDVERLAEWFHNKWESQGLACWHKNQHMRSWDCGRDAIEAAEAAQEAAPRAEELDVERLAALEHEQWAHWTRYMLDNLTPENIERWRQQINTSYADLSEKEKESDREWARKVLARLSRPSDERVPEEQD